MNTVWLKTRISMLTLNFYQAGKKEVAVAGMKTIKISVSCLQVLSLEILIWLYNMPVAWLLE
jgi:hypothetical protein